MTKHPPLPREVIEELQYLLDCYGAYEHHWPEDRREWIKALMDRSPEARILRAKTVELDQLLDLSPSEPDSSHLVDNILAQAPSQIQSKSEILNKSEAFSKSGKDFVLSQWWPFESIWRPLSALTTAGAFGLMLGTTSPDILISQDAIEFQDAYVAFSSNSFTNDFLEGEIE